MLFETNTQPIDWMRGNIFVTSSGVPHAIWNLEGLPYGKATIEQKKIVAAHHQNLFQSITGESMILGIVAAESSDSVRQKMLDGIENPSPHWLKECDLTRLHQENFPSGKRFYFLIVPLSFNNIKEFGEKTLENTYQFFRKTCVLDPTPPPESKFEIWKTRALSIEGKIPSAFKAKPVDSATLKWITQKITERGGNIQNPLKIPEEVNFQRWSHMRNVICEPWIDEGDLTTLRSEKMFKSVNSHIRALKRPFIRVETSESNPSYQQFGTIGATPSAGFVFPGAEFVNQASDLPINIDFCLRIKSVSAQTARTENRKAEKNLRDQYDHRERTGGNITGGYAELDESAELLAEYTGILNASEREVEISSTIIFSTSGPDAETATESMKILRTLYQSDDWIIDVPLGGQTNLFWDMWPGAIQSNTCRESKQIIPGVYFSYGVPITTDDLGAKSGFRIGTNITTGRYAPVYMNLAGMAENDVSGSFGAVGELGAGKSVFLKTVASHCLDRGATLVCIDNSDSLEYAALAQSLSTANIIDFMNPTQSLDPLKLWGFTPQGIKETLNLMIMMLGVSVESDEGIFLNSELRQGALDGESAKFKSLSGLKEHLLSENIKDEDKTIARRISRLMDVYSEIDFGKTFFDESLPPADLSYQATVFCTRGMTLPSKDELLLESARKEMSINKKVGRAVYAYLASIGTSIMYRSITEEVLFLVDEAHHMTGSPEGEETISKAIKTGRKYKSAVGLGTHTASELGPKKLRGLIPQRLVFRSRDKDIAAENLSWLDNEFNNQEYIDLVTKNLSPMGENDSISEDRRGECIYRDQRDRIGLMKVLIPREITRAKTVLTTPGKNESKK